MDMNVLNGSQKFGIIVLMMFQIQLMWLSDFYLFIYFYFYFYFYFLEELM